MQGEAIILNSWPISAYFSMEAVLHDHCGWHSIYLNSAIYNADIYL